MRFQFNPSRSLRFFTTHSTRRAVLISAFVFSAAIAMGYIGTAANPDVAGKVSRTINTILGNPSASAKDLRPELGEVVASHLTVQDPVQDPPPPLTTDKTGYLAGQTVIVSGTGFWANETITIQVTHTDGTAESGMGHEPSTATAGENGAFNSSWSVPTNDAKGHNFTLTATGNSSAISSALQFNRIATIKADKLDYQPGETAAITGEGFQANEVVVLLVVHSNGNNFGAGHQPFEATADSAGRLTASWYVNPDDSEGSIFRLTASGQASGLVASSTFYDPPIAFIDDAGPDDEPGQKDLTAMSSDLGATSVAVTWNWDDTDFGNLGGDTGDACALVDTDQDGFANFSFCVVADGDPASQVSNRLFSCVDTRSDRCAGPTEVLTFTSTSSASVVANSDPFKAHPAHSSGNDCDDNANCLTDDTVANVTLQLSDVGGASAARLINVCSYPSREPNSDPSDCVIAPDRGFLTIRKTTQTNENTTTSFAFNTSVASVGGVSNFSANITGQQANVVVANQVLFAAGTLNLSEVVPTGWDLTGASCAIQTAVPTPTGSFSGNTITGLTIQTGLETICTFTNGAFNVTRGKIIVDKVTNPGGDTTSFDFTSSYGSPFSLTDAATPNDSGFLIPGNFSVAETANSAYVTTANCTSNALDPDQDPSSIDLAAGEIVTCTFTNTKKGSIKIVKNTVGGNGTFDFTSNFGVSQITTAGGTGEQTVNDLSPGTNYSISEQDELGWDEGTFSCDNGTAAAIEVLAGQTTTCTITNTKQGSIKIVKNTVGGNGTFDFTSNFGVSQITTAGGTGEQTVNDLSPGTNYSISEQDELGWDEGTFSCDNGTAAAIEVLAGQTTTCTITNTKQGSIKIVKNTVGGNGTFDFTSNFGVSQITTAGGTGEQTVNDLSPGTNYSISEQDELGWDEGTFSCDNGTAAAIEVLAGQTTTCTITNTKQGSIKIVKNTVGGNGTFDFTSNFGVSQITTAGGTGEQTVNNLSPGTNYSISEQDESGWDEGTFSCDNGTAAAIEVLAGQTTTCTITNTKQGSIKIVKNTVGGNGTFDFTSNFGVSQITTAGGTGEQTVNNLSPGTNYSISEQDESGWDEGTFSCDNGTAAAIEVLAGQTTTCTITNTKQGSIKIVKNTVGGNGTFDFTSNFGVSQITTAGGTGEQTVNNLSPGTNYSISEQDELGWDEGTFSCNKGTAAAIEVLAGQTTTCTITNTKQGKIIVEKQTNPNGATGNFTFTGAAAGTISDNGTIEVNNLSPGTYYSTEGDPTPGFDLTSIVCDDSGSATPSSGSLTTRKATFKLDPGETVKCTFTNTQRGMVVVNKTTNGSAATMPIFNFSLTGPNVPGGPNVTTNDVNDANGVIDFGGRKILPNVTYTVCELVPAGYTSFWRADINGDGTAEIITPYNPNASDVPPQDLGVRCYNFTVDPGEMLTFLIDNSRPGGDPRTIGYWKNWNRCTGGGQAANADNSGGPAFGVFLMEDLLPQLIGDFNVVTCQQGVKILGKQDQGGKNKANDAAYELAAQLLAAKLNLAAGAETCQAVADAIVAAQNLLDSLNFTGSGGYLDSKVKGPLATQRTLALGLANTLDRYNNGNLCL